MSRIEVAVASAAEVERLIEWAAREGWNPGLGDLVPFRAADPDGFRVVRRDGEPIAGVSVVRWGERFAFLGFYICVPSRRGRGHGLTVWREGIAHAGDRTVGLDGVVAEQENYRRSGFVLAHRNLRYGGRVELPKTARDDVVTVTPTLLPALARWDAPRFGADRGAFLAHWCDGRGGRLARACVRDGRIRGWGVIRPCRQGHKIGPLFAEDESVAEALFTALAGEVGETELFVDPPGPNAAARRLYESHGLAPVFETARMYRGVAPELPLAEIWGITTFELG